MKILGLVGSPRHDGNTSKMIEYLLKSADGAGHETEIIHLNDLSYKGCQGCYGCAKSFKCVLKDDLSKVYAAIEGSDEIIIGSPIYMWQATGQVKSMLDRFLPYYMDHNKGEGFDKKVVFAYSQGDSDAEINGDYIRSMEQIIERLGFTFKDTFVSGGELVLNDKDEKSELVTKMKEYYL